MNDELRTFINDYCIFRPNPRKRYCEELEPGRLLSKNPANNVGMTYQFHLRKMLFEPYIVEFAAKFMLGKIQDKFHGPFQLAGLESASVPLLVAMQTYARVNSGICINAFSIRKERKSYGIGNLFEGTPNGYPVIIVDDLVNSGKSFLHAVTTCQAFGLEVAPLVGAIVSLCTEKNEDLAFQISDQMFDSFCLFTKDDFDLKSDGQKYWFPIDMNI